MKRLAIQYYESVNKNGRPELFRDTLGATTPKSRILKLSNSVRANISAGKVRITPKAYSVSRDLAGLIKIRHAIEMGETQGALPMHDYLLKLASDSLDDCLGRVLDLVEGKRDVIELKR